MLPYMAAYRGSMRTVLCLDEFAMWQHQSAASTEIGSVGAAEQKDHYTLTVILASLHSEFRDVVSTLQQLKTY